MKNKIRISVIMVVHNLDLYLKESIDSILKQSYKQFEFLILDDGSTDETLLILKSYNDKRIHIYKNTKQQGLPKGLNTLLSKAKGQYIARMDGDDISSKERLSLQENILDQNPNISLVGSWVKIIDKQGRVIGETKYPVRFEDIRKNILDANPFTHSTIMFRKKIIDEIGGYNDKLFYCQDYDFYLRLANKYKYINIDKFLLKYRWQPNFPKQKQQHLAALKIRLYALQHYDYPKWEVIKLIKPFFLYLLPTWLKKIYWQEKFYDKN